MLANFWDFIWLFLWGFFLIAYLIVLFQIVIDVFSDTKLNGWGKAVWVIALIFFPMITAIIYLIARGGGMTRRRAAQYEASRAEMDSYIRNVASTSPADEIGRAKSLLDSGTISEAEYAALKAKALAA